MPYGTEMKRLNPATIALTQLQRLLSRKCGPAKLTAGSNFTENQASASNTTWYWAGYLCELIKNLTVNSRFLSFVLKQVCGIRSEQFVRFTV